MQTLEPGCFVIVGRTTGGKVFRPSDWDHRLCGVLSQFNQGKLEYSSKVRPTVHGSDKAVFISGDLKASNPDMWNFILNFAKDNDMQIVWPDVCILPE